MSAANRKRNGWGSTPVEESTQALSVGMLFVTSLAHDEVASLRRFRAESARNRAQHQRRNKSTPDVHYNPMPYLTEPATRRGADDALAIPSRTGDRLTYRDGSVVILSSQRSTDHVQ